MTDLEGALNKLDRLMQEEARMAHAEVLRIAHNIRNEVKVVDGKVEKVEDKVEGVGNKIEEVGDRVQCVDDKVQLVINGARVLSIQSETLRTAVLSDGKQAKVVAKEIGDKIADLNDKVENVSDKVEGVGDKVQCVDNKIQMAIDGARVLSSQLLPIYLFFRRQASKGRGEGSKVDYSTDVQRHR